VKNSKLIIVGILFSSLLIALPSALGRSKKHPDYISPSDALIGKLLGWVQSDNPSCSACGGYFVEPKFISKYPSPPSYKKVPTHITANGPTIFSRSGQSILQKNVRVTQPGRIVKADKAYVFRDRHTGKIARIKLVGNVHMQEHGKLIISKKASLNLKEDTAQMDHIAYRFYQENPRMEKYNNWGSAEQALRTSKGDLKLRHATYSTCSPMSPSWQFTASRINLNKKKKRVSASNVVIRLHHIPIMYTPYISVSMDKTRKSGLIVPLIQNSTSNGFTWSQGLYLNLAPNYDLLLNSAYMSKRGVLTNGLFRYLTPSSHGKIYMSFIPNDRGFINFKKETFGKFSSPTPSQFLPYVTELRNTSNYRGYFSYADKSVFNDRWSGGAEINYVTDPYYFNDFGEAVNDVAANQLLNQANLNYTGTHWNFSILGQGYQTLHLIGQTVNPTVNQYYRVPELDVSTDYPDIFPHVNFDMTAQAVNFAYHSAFPPFTNQQPVGQRFHVLPTISRPINWASGYFTPSVSVDSTSYNVNRAQLGQASESSRNLPIIDLDTGIYLERLFHWHKKGYFQTLEPRLFYLYVPFVNQNKYPNYDTQVLPFTYEQLFALNRFTGFDRVQNANQLSFGLTSRILDATNAYERMKADIGFGYYFSRPRVCLATGCTNDHIEFTPIISQLFFYPAEHWSTSASIAWDPEQHQTNNAQIAINYGRDGKHIIGAGYTFVHAQPNTPSYSTLAFSSDASLYNVHIAWPLLHRWSAIGYLYYNVSQHRAESFFAGLQYDTCCWSFRFIINKVFSAAEPINNGTAIHNKYTTSYTFQIQLKGIGSAGNNDPNALLTNNIPGYFDPFKY